MKKICTICILVLAAMIGNQIFFQPNVAFAYEKSFSQDGIDVAIDIESINSDAGKRISYLNVIVMQRVNGQNPMENVTYKYRTNDNGKNWYYSAFSTNKGNIKNKGMVGRGSYQKRILNDCLMVLYD